MANDETGTPPAQPDTTLTRTGPRGGVLRPWQKGQSGNPSGDSKHRRELRAAIEANCLPDVLKVLDAMKAFALAGDAACAKVWLDRVLGPVKATDDEKIQAMAEAMMRELLAKAEEERQRRVVDVKEGP